jgi:hypothetical protein
LRATTKSVEVMVAIPVSFLAAIFAFADDRFATATLFETLFALT